LNFTGKKLFLISFIIISSMVFVSCGYKRISGNKEAASEVSMPAYVKNMRSVVSQNGITIRYNPPVTVEKLPEVTKPYTFSVKRNIPEKWIAGELTWPLEKPSNNIDLCFFNGTYVLEQTYAANSKHEVLKLYKRKNANSPLPKKLSYSDFTLVKVLDKAPDRGPLPQNQDFVVSDNFVVWVASSLNDCGDWTAWAYDIKNNKTYPLFSYKDFPYGEPSYVYNKGDILTLVAETEDKDGTLISELMLYNLHTRKLQRVASSREFVFSEPILLNGKLYVNEYKMPQSNKTWGIVQTVVVFDVADKTSKVLIPAEANFSIDRGLSGRITFTASPKNYPFKDIWVLDTSTNELTCYVKVRASKTDDCDYIRANGLSTNKGLFYGVYCNSTGTYYFYDYKDKKAYSIGSVIAMDAYGRFLVAKNEYDLFNPPPPFEYPGKEERMKGFITFLIIQPD